MSTITMQEHKELINSLIELNGIIDEMKKISSDMLLTWQENEICDWLNYLEKHTDKEELKSLEIEIGDRFFYKYNVRIEPVNLDKQRLNVFQNFIARLNSALK